MEKSINISQLLGIRRFATEFSSFGDDYIFMRLTNSNRPDIILDSPIRINGVTFILCRKGRMAVDVNLNKWELTENALMCIGQDNIVSISAIDWESLDAYILFISTEFMRNINIDPNVLQSFPVSYPLSLRPVLPIEISESDLVSRYFDLIHLNTTDNPDDLYVRSISRCLLSALVYQVLQFIRKRKKIEESMRPHSRRTTYVTQFMKLVHEFHQRERAVGFYAARLYISPKYLSLIIKESTGRSAAEWIDDFVILEAKNMLRFSGKNIQQVAYELNFPNQSAFGKYFKHLTGLSPSEYQRS